MLQVRLTGLLSPDSLCDSSSTSLGRPEKGKVFAKAITNLVRFGYAEPAVSPDVEMTEKRYGFDRKNYFEPNWFR